MANFRDVQQAESDTEDFVLSAQKADRSIEERMIDSNIAIARAIQELGIRIDYVASEVIVPKL